MFEYSLSSSSLQSSLGQNCYVFKRKLKFRILIIYEIIFENFQKEYLFKKFNILSFVTTNRFFLSKRNLLIGQINHIGLFLSNIDGGGGHTPYGFALSVEINIDFYDFLKKINNVKNNVYRMIYKHLLV